MGIFRHDCRLLACSAALSVLAFTGAAQAQGASETELAPVVVQGQKVKKAASPSTDTPLATQTTATDIQTKEISNISDLGNTTEPGVEYSSKTDGPVIRGLDGPRVLTVVDGIPIPYLDDYARSSTSSMNSPTSADGGGSAFDFSSISALDVLRGADSSRIGSGVLGGAIVLRTLEPEDLLEEGRRFGGMTKITYSSEDDSIGGALAVAGRDGPVSVLLQAAYKNGGETENKGTDDSYGANRTEPNPLDFDQNNVLFKIRHTGESGHRIGLTAERFARDSIADLATNWNRGGTGPTTYAPDNYFGNDKTVRERVSLDYSFTAPTPGGLIDYAYATAYWQNLTKNGGYEGTRRSGAYNLRDNEIENDSFGIVGGATGQFESGSLKHDWSVGIDISSFTTRQFIEALPTSVVTRSQADMPEVDGTKFGAYIEDRISFGDSGFSLTPGLRFDWHQYTPQETDEYLSTNVGTGVFDFPGKNSDSNFTPKILATYELAPKVEVFAQWSAAYRAPTVNELYLNFTNPVTGYAQIGDPNLKPETGHGIEVGTNLGDSEFGGRVTGFYNKYKNFISAGDLEPDPAYPSLAYGIGRFENIDKVTIYGVELRAHKVFDNGIRLHGGFSYAHGEDGEGNRLATVAPYKGILGVGYERENWGVDLTGIFVGKYNDDTADTTVADTTFDAPSYAVANVSAWWEPTAFKGMRIQAGIKNLFDETYYDALAVRSVNLASSSSQPMEFYSEPGRTFTISLTQKF